MLLNPAFHDPGALPGEAAHWALRTLCQAQRIAGFGPVPETAAEDFERWAEFDDAFEPGALSMAMFDPLAEGLEDFEEAWNLGPFLTELTGGNEDPAVFSGSDFEDMDAGWLAAPFVSAWSDVTAAVGMFGAQPLERFEEWYPYPVATWSAAGFDGLPKSFDDFAGTWPAMHTI